MSFTKKNAIQEYILFLPEMSNALQSKIAYVDFHDIDIFKNYSPNIL